MSKLYPNALWPELWGLFSKQIVIRSQKVTLSTYESHMSDWERFIVCVKTGIRSQILFTSSLPLLLPFSFGLPLSHTGPQSDIFIHSAFLLNSVYFQVCHGSCMHTEGLLIHRPSPHMSQKLQHCADGCFEGRYTELYDQLYDLYNLMFHIMFICNYCH